MNFFNSYKYLFYHMYSFSLRTWGKTDVPEYTAVFIISFLLFLNILALLMGIELATGFNISKKTTVIHAIIALIVIDIINYFIFIHKNKYEKIAKQFSKETRIERKRRSIWCLAYEFFSFLGFFGLLLIFSSRP